MLSLALSLLLSSAPADAGTPARFAWPMPGLVNLVEVPGEVRVGGIRTRLKQVRLKGSLDSLVDVYARAFVAAGFHLAPPRYQPQMEGKLALTALDGERRLSYTVLLESNADGSTTVILGEANLGELNGAKLDFAPAMPGAKHLLRSEQEGWNLASYEVQAPASDVETFYREALTKAGFVEADDPTLRGAYTRNGEALQVRTRQRADATFVLLTHRLR